MMRVLFYNHTGQVSGAEGVMLMVLARLDRKSFDPLVVCPAQGPLAQMAAACGVRTEALNGLEARFTWRPDRLARYLKSFFQVVREMRRQIIKFSPELVHANSIRAGLVATVATFDLGTRVVWHLHDLLPRHPLSSAIRIFAALSFRTRMIAVSEAVSRNFRGRLARVFKARVRVILNGIELKKFEPSQAAGRDIRDGLGLNGAHPVLGIVGQLTPRKGQLELVRAFAQTLTQLPQAVLLIVGAPLFNRDHEYAERLEREVAALGIATRVLMLGPRSDVAAIMQALDLLVVNSSAEPFGLVALEAMACGTPVLSTAVGGTREMIEHGKTGWLVPQGNEEALTAAIVDLCRQPALRAEIVRQGKSHVASRFSAERYLSELEDFYRSNTASKAEALESVEARSSFKREGLGVS